jgi:hypothetical protein
MIRRQVIGAGIILGILGGLFLDAYMRAYPSHITYASPPEEPQVVQIEVVIDWTPERIKQEIRETFPEAPETMLRVAKCESGLVPHAYNPTNGSHDGGIYQISLKYHGDRLEQLGLDRFDIEDNLKYARMLYDESGLAPWSASKHCWSK